MFRYFPIKPFFFFITTLFILFMPQQPIFAATITVDDSTSTVANNGACSLREAIINANNGNQSGSTDCTAGGGVTDTILLDVNITLTVVDNTLDGNNGLPSITTPIIIGGQGNTIERGMAVSETFRLFHIATSGTLHLYSTTLSNGSAQETDDGIFTDDDGGAIFNFGILQITNSTLIGNAAGFGGGGIYSFGEGTIVKIHNSTISDNFATSAGGGLLQLQW